MDWYRVLHVYPLDGFNSGIHGESFSQKEVGITVGQSRIARLRSLMVLYGRNTVDEFNTVQRNVYDLFR